MRPVPDWYKTHAGNTERICEGEGQPGDIELLQEIALKVGKAPLRFGAERSQSGTNDHTLLSEEYEAHINEKDARLCSAKPSSLTVSTLTNAKAAVYAPKNARLTVLRVKGKTLCY